MAKQLSVSQFLDHWLTIIMAATFLGSTAGLLAKVSVKASSAKVSCERSVSNRTAFYFRRFVLLNTDLQSVIGHIYPGVRLLGKHRRRGRMSGRPCKHGLRRYSLNGLCLSFG